MAKTDNFSQLVCDRCGTTTYAAANSPEMQRWKDIKRIDQGGVDVTRLLCSKCATAYRKLVAEQDSAFSDFMAETEE